MTPTAPSAGDDHTRALAPVGAVLLIALTVVLAGSIAAGTLSAVGPTEPPPTASLSLDVDGERVTVTHRAGDPVPVGTLDVHVTVNGEPLAHQPPVPFFSATGFRPGPTGAFNAASDTETLTAGESASFQIAGSNDPALSGGDEVELRLTVRDGTVATLAARAETEG
ncbi:hypothetical protein JCM17823_20000 [Halorubrum gandharaense]